MAAATYPWGSEARRTNCIVVQNTTHVRKRCLALYEQDNKWYEAVVEGRDEDVGTYTVRFLGFNNVYEVDQDSEIKEIPEIPQGYRDGGA